MDKREQINELLIELLKAFPEWGKDRSPESMNNSFDLYERALSDIPIHVLAKTIWAIVNTHTFFPHIIDIRRTADEMQGLGHPSALEGWNDVLCANSSNVLAKDVFKLLRIDRSDIGRMDFTTVSVLQSHFIKEYEKRAEKEKRERLLPTNLRSYGEQSAIPGPIELKPGAKPEQPDKPISAELFRSLVASVREKVDSAQEKEKRKKDDELTQRKTMLREQGEKLLRADRGNSH